MCRRVPPGTQATAAFVAKADGVLAGLAVVDQARMLYLLNISVS